MDRDLARDLYFKYRAGVAYVAVETPSGDQSIGTAYHVGDNIWLTAAHVVDGNTVLEIATTGPSLSDYTKRLKAHAGAFDSDWFSPCGYYEMEGAPMLHPDGADVAALRLRGPLISRDDPRPFPALRPPRTRPATPVIALGGWLDDWLDDGLLLEAALLMGYPPIPFANEPVLVATLTEVNAVLDKRHEGHPYFILSATPRGGFSGSLALTRFELSLGVTTESLTHDYKPTETGFLAVLSVEPAYVLLEHHGVLPSAQDLGGIFQVREQ